MSDRQTAMRNDDLEARIRASLRARADDIDPTPPAWENLVDRAGAIVVPLRPGDTDVPPAHLAPGRLPLVPRVPRPWLRPILAAAAALAVVLGATILVEDRDGDGNTTPGDADTVVREVPESPVIPAPGSIDFVPVDATFLPGPNTPGPVDSTDPKQLATEYLASWQLDEEELAAIGYSSFIEEPKLLEPGIQTMWWGVTDSYGNTVARGAVFVRETGNGRWAVIGAYTSQVGMPVLVTLSGVRRADGGVWFSVGDYSMDPSVRVRLNGAILHDGDLDGGSGDPNKTFYEPDPAPGKVITIEVQHLEDGQSVSITAMALAPAAPVAPAPEVLIDKAPTIPPDPSSPPTSST